MGFRKPHKYGAKRTMVDGIAFPSQLEAALYCKLTLLVKAGELKDLVLQDSVLLLDAKKPKDRIRSKIDFKATHCLTGLPVWFESKGLEDDRFKLIKRLWKAFGPGRLELWKGSATRLFLAEVIERET